MDPVLLYAWSDRLGEVFTDLDLAPFEGVGHFPHREAPDRASERSRASSTALHLTPGAMLFLLKIAVPPILVALMSLAARRWGPTVGGLLMGLPWMTGPVLFFLGLDKGGEFAVAACAGIQLGVVCICAFMLAYSATSIVAPWPFCLAAATVAFAVVGWIVQGQPIPLVPAAAAALAVLVATYLPAAAAAHAGGTRAAAVVGHSGPHGDDFPAGRPDHVERGPARARSCPAWCRPIR